MEPGIRPERPLLYDLDNDSDLDIILANGSYSNVRWLENDGTGNFLESVELVRSKNVVMWVCFGDIDGDSDKDLIVSSSNQVTWYEKINGTVDFGAGQLVTDSVSSGRKIDCGDIDGDIDIAVTSYFGDWIGWVENTDGLGTFGYVIVVSNDENGAVSVELDDVDLDGDLDMLTASKDRDIVRYFKNDGNGIFSLEKAVGATDASFLKAYDMNQDGDKDLVYFSANVFLYWLKNSSGSFPSIYTLTSNTYFCYHIIVGKIDGDSLPDVMIANGGNHDVWWLKNNGGGNFAFGNMLDPDALGTDYFDMGDIDNDGDMDVVTSESSHYEIGVFKNDGNGFFTNSQQINTIVQYVISTWPSDLDGDGDMDILISGDDDNNTAWCENLDGLGNNFAYPQVIDTSTSGSFTKSADLDGDGDMDVVTSREDAYQNILWYENNGLGNFNNSHTISYWNGGAKSFDLADLDGDNDIDILVGMWNGEEMTWFENTDGLGTFGPKQVFDTGDNITKVVAADIDGDGDKDAVAVAWWDGLFWYENTDGVGTFGTKQVILSGGHGSASLRVADIDGDNDLDIIAAKMYSKVLYWYENTDGLGTFSSMQVINDTIDVEISSVNTFDFDFDNDLDIITTSYNTGAISLFENLDGLANFGPQQDIFTGYLLAEGTNVADINGDGKQDLVVCYSSWNKVLWLRDASQCSSDTTFLGDTICQGDTIVVNGTSLFNSGTYYETLITSTGCDSILEISLTVNQTFEHKDTIYICQNDSVMIFGNYENQTGIFYDSLNTIDGCDSIIITNLRVNPVYSLTINVSVCQGTFYTLPGGTVVTTQGIYTDTMETTLGCDSIINTELSLDSLVIQNNPVAICSDENYQLPLGDIVSAAGTYHDTLSSGSQCDSVIITTLAIQTVDTSLTQAGDTLVATNTNAIYQWINCDNANLPLGGETTQSFTATATGNYAVILTENGCIDTSSCYTITKVGIEKALSGKNISIYSNTTSGIFTIDLGQDYKDVQLSISNVLGNKIATKIKILNSQLYLLDLRNYSNGIYFIHLIADYNNKVVKVLKVHE